MFDSLRIKNFRSIRDSGEIKLSDLNVFVGPNNSGKSSILYALMMIKMSIESKSEDMALITSMPELDLGSYLDLIRDSNTERRLMLKFTLDSPDVHKPLPIFVEYGREKFYRYASLQAEFCFDKDRNRIDVVSFIGKDASGRNLLRLSRTAEGDSSASGQRSLSTPDIVEVHLRADKNLSPETAAALAEVFRAAYEHFSKRSKND